MSKVKRRATMSVSQKLVSEAILRLDTAKADYTITYEGEVFSNGSIAVAKPNAKGLGKQGRGVRILPNGYLNDLVKKVSDGNIHTIVPPNGIAPDYLRARLTGNLARTYGAGSYVTSLTNDKKGFEVWVTKGSRYE